MAHLALELTKLGLEVAKVALELGVEVARARGELRALRQEREAKTASVSEYQTQLAALGPARIGDTEALYGTLDLTTAGLYYSGVFVDGELEGFGEMRNGDMYYQGQFHDGDPHGLGKMVWNDRGVSYVGYFVNGQFSGHGQFTTSKGSLYAGMFEKGEIVNGTIVLANGTIFEGTMENWQPKEGKVVYGSGIEYVGTFCEWKWEGEGVITFPKRNKQTGKPYKALSYRGAFQDCNYHGQGTMEWRTGKIWTGLWEKSEMKQGEWIKQ